MNMKVMLIEPPEAQVVESDDEYRMEAGFISGIGLVCLAAYIEDVAEVRILEGLWQSREKILAEIAQFQPDLIGLSVVATPSISKALKMAAAIRAMAPGVPIIAGGHGATFSRLDLLQSGLIDLIVRGEGEITLRDLVTSGFQFKNAQGVSYLDDDKRLVDNPDRELISDLDTMRLPAYHFSASRILYQVELNRGCPYPCSFCTGKRFWGHKLREKSPERTMEEIRLLIDRHGAWFVGLFSDTTPLRKERFGRFLEMFMAEDLGSVVSPIIGTRVTEVARNPEMVKLMAKAGIRAVEMGIESPHPESLKKICKGINPEDAKTAVKLLKDHGISVWGFFIIGIPGETEEMMWQTRQYAIDLDLDTAGFSVLSPLPGSPFFDECVEKGWLLHRDWDKYDGHHIVTSVNPPGCDKLIARFTRDFYYRERWVKDHISLQPREQFQTMLNKFSWVQTFIPLVGGPPESLEQWQEIFNGLLPDLNPVLEKEAGDLTIHLRVHHDAFSFSLLIENGRTYGFTPQKPGYECSLRIPDRILSALFGSGERDLLDVVSDPEVHFDGDLDQLITLLAWTEKYQRYLDFDFGGVMFQRRTIKLRINRLLDSDQELRSLARGRQIKVAFAASFAYLYLHLRRNGRCQAYELKNGQPEAADFRIDLTDAQLLELVLARGQALQSALQELKSRIPAAGDILLSIFQSQPASCPIYEGEAV
ncbi:MAG: radical SAM protein [bacterium]